MGIGFKGTFRAVQAFDDRLKLLRSERGSTLLTVMMMAVVASVLMLSFTQAFQSRATQMQASFHEEVRDQLAFKIHRDIMLRQAYYNALIADPGTNAALMQCAFMGNGTGAGCTAMVENPLALYAPEDVPVPGQPAVTPRRVTGTPGAPAYYDSQGNLCDPANPGVAKKSCPYMVTTTFHARCLRDYGFCADATPPVDTDAFDVNGRFDPAMYPTQCTAGMSRLDCEKAVVQSQANCTVAHSLVTTYTIAKNPDLDPASPDAKVTFPPISDSFGGAALRVQQEAGCALANDPSGITNVPGSAPGSTFVNGFSIIPGTTIAQFCQMGCAPADGGTGTGDTTSTSGTSTTTDGTTGDPGGSSGTTTVASTGGGGGSGGGGTVSGPPSAGGGAGGSGGGSGGGGGGGGGTITASSGGSGGGTSSTSATSITPGTASSSTSGKTGGGGDGGGSGGSAPASNKTTCSPGWSPGPGGQCFPST